VCSSVSSTTRRYPRAALSVEPDVEAPNAGVRRDLGLSRDLTKLRRHATLLSNTNVREIAENAVGRTDERTEVARE